MDFDFDTMTVKAFVENLYEGLEIGDDRFEINKVTREAVLHCYQGDPAKMHFSDAEATALALDKFHTVYCGCHEPDAFDFGTVVDAVQTAAIQRVRQMTFTRRRED